ncbi:MAG: bacteriorhodopsin [Leptolyngbyaceae cyanobacterium RM2_2_4]|nr:bacteriorhodopsin [Leptolyngbyaceae cyanobacterium SM1_4_3]NJO49459.1 bacteriorhodopsin [Leptolyngbyaceae cyanobacterium RM2_2_4]NJO75531.1 bacteriorhodopsin [Leptolyngbyaceae cyanobacterium RM1_406_9]
MSAILLPDLSLLGAVAQDDLLDRLSVVQSLSSSQFNLVYNGFSFAIATMFASALFFLNARAQVGQKYRLALLVSAIVVSIAGYHYFRIFNSWDAAYTLQNGVYTLTGEPFNDAYRYVDWLLTVPLLLVEAVAVLALPVKEAKPLLIKLAAASVVMIATGYPGEISSDLVTRIIWGTVSTIPFAYILYVLWVELSKSLVRQPEAVQSLVRNMRLLLLLSWGVYPIAYLLPMLGITGTSATVGVQIGYTIADVLAKPVFGLLVFAIAVAKTKVDQGGDSIPTAAAQAAELDLVAASTES